MAFKRYIFTIFIALILTHLNVMSLKSFNANLNIGYEYYLIIIFMTNVFFYSVIYIFKKIKFRKLLERKHFNADVKRKILEIQKNKCAIPNCTHPINKVEYLEFDHISGRNDNSLQNCQALCPLHHREKTNLDRKKNM